MLDGVDYPAGFEDLVRGKMMDLPSQESNVVRVFLSSTFTDTIHERNRLLKDVFPDLQRHCQEKGLDFEVVDMRWGVRDNATADHLTSALCVKEIETCKRLSVGPHFVGFLGNKYGYRPLPSSIESGHFERLSECISSLEAEAEAEAETEEGADKASAACRLLADWYVQDTNAVPPVHVLQPITAILRNFYNAQEPELQQQERSQWWSTYRRLQRLLQRGAKAACADGILTPEEMADYFESVTEIEVRQGLSGVADPNESCLFFCRDLEGLGVDLEDEATKSYMDLDEDGSVDTIAQASLRELKTGFLPSALGPGAIRSFSLPWTPAGIDPSRPDHAHYLDTVCEIFREGIRSRIDRSLAQRLEVRDPAVAGLYEEVLHHAKFCETKCSVFHGRQDLLMSLRDYLSADPAKPLVVHGVSGSGKTSVMAMLARHCSDWLGRDFVTVLRFLGTSGQSTGIHATLQSMCRQICYAYGKEQPSSTTLDDFTEVTKCFRRLVATAATQQRPLLVIFDSVDQLSAANDAHALNWLPTSLPAASVRLVVSVLTRDQHDCLEKARRLLPDDRCYVGMSPVAPETGLEILGHWLAGRGRRLTEGQLGSVAAAFAACPQPLFLKLVFESVSRWRSYADELATRPLPASVREAIAALFQELEHKHGQIVISHALGYISAARSGMAGAEIEDALSCDDEVLNDVYQYWDPPAEKIVRTPPSLWKRIHYDVEEFLSERQSGGKTVVAWYHRQFIEAAIDHYLSERDLIARRHRLLADMFLGKYSVGTVCPITLHKRGKSYPEADRQVAPQPLEFGRGLYNRRKLLELPHHLSGAGMLEELVERALCNFDWLLAKLVAFGFRECLADFRPVGEEIVILTETMYLSSSNLKVDPFALAGQLLGRIGDYGGKYPNIRRLLGQARAWIRTTERPLFVPRAACLIPPGGPLRTVFGGHPSLVLKVACTPSGELMLSACLDRDGLPMLNVWNMATLEVVHTLQRTTNESPPVKAAQISLCVTADSRYVVFGKRSLAVLDLVTGECLRELQTDGLESFSNLQVDGGGARALASCQPGNLVCIWTLADGKREAAIQHPGQVVFLSLLPDGGTLLSVCREGKLRVWSAETQECLSSQAGHEEGGTVSCAALTPSKRHLITGSSDGRVKLWPLDALPAASPASEVSVPVKEPLLSIVAHSESAFVLRDSSSVARICHLAPDGGDPNVIRLAGHDGLITCVWIYAEGEVGGDGVFVVTGSKDDTLKVWALSDGSCVNTLKGHSSWISDVTVLTTDEGPRVLSACNDKTVKMWLPTKGEVTKRDRHELSGQCIALAGSPPDSLVGISGSKDKLTKFWDLERGRCFRSVDCNAVALEVLEAQGTVLCGTDAGEVVAFRTDTGREVWRRTLFKKAVAAMVLAPKQTVLICSKDAADGAVRVCDAAGQLEEKFRLDGHSGPTTILRAVESRENPAYLSASKTAGEIKVWDDIMGNCLATMQHEQVMSMEVSPDSRCLATGSNTGVIKVWSLETIGLGRLVATLEGLYKDTIVCLAFDQDSRQLISGAHVGRDQLLVWDFQANEKRFLRGHNHAVMSVSVTPNNKYVLSSSRDCTLKAWCLETGSLLASFDCQSQIKFFKFATMAEDHYRLVATNQSGTIAMLDLLLAGAQRGTEEEKEEEEEEGRDTRPDSRRPTQERSPDEANNNTNKGTVSGNKKKGAKKFSKICITI